MSRMKKLKVIRVKTRKMTEAEWRRFKRGDAFVRWFEKKWRKKHG